MQTACHPNREGLYLTLNAPVLVTVPPTYVVTLIRPVVAPAGTSTVIIVEVFDLITAGVPLKLTEVAPESLDPLTVTSLPALALVGEKLVILGLPLVL